MFLGVSTMIWEKSGRGLADSLKAIADMGFRHIDIAGTRSADPTKLSKQDRGAAVTMVKDLGLSVNGMVLLEADDIATPDSENRRRQMEFAKQSARFMVELGGEHLLVGLGCGSVAMSTGAITAWVNSSTFLGEYCEWLQREGITLPVLLEFDPAVFYVVRDTISLDRMLCDVGRQNLFANIDVGHMNVTREMPAAMWKLKDRILHVHLSDNDGRDDAHQALGRGNAPIKQFVDELVRMDLDSTCSRHGVTPVATIELGERKESDPEVAVRLSIEYLERNGIRLEK